MRGAEAKVGQGSCPSKPGEIKSDRAGYSGDLLPPSPPAEKATAIASIALANAVAPSKLDKPRYGNGKASGITKQASIPAT